VLNQLLLFADELCVAVVLGVANRHFGHILVCLCVGYDPKLRGVVSRVVRYEFQQY